VDQRCMQSESGKVPMIFKISRAAEDKLANHPEKATMKTVFPMQNVPSSDNHLFTDSSNKIATNSNVVDLAIHSYRKIFFKQQEVFIR
jgi:hypothetical protein